MFIIPSNSEDFGIYACTATNTLGTDVLYVKVVRTGQKTLHLELNIACSYSIAACS